MVDCPIEDVPFREGTFGGAGKWCPYLRPASLYSQCLVSPRLSPPLRFPKAKPATPLARHSRLRHWLRPPQAPILGAGFEASTVRADCSFSQGRP